MFFFGVSPACGAASAGGVFGASVAVPELGVSAAGASGAAGEAGSGVSARAVANEAGTRSARATSVTRNLRRSGRRANVELHIGESVAPTGLLTNRGLRRAISLEHGGPGHYLSNLPDLGKARCTIG